MLMLGTGLLAALGLAVLACNLWVIQSTDAFLYDSPTAIPPKGVGLVLGTSPWSREGRANAHFRGRVESAALLYKRGALQHVLLSGANPSDRYNEPRAMYKALAELGVDGQDMTLDFAGFRTLDSVVRAKQIFGLDDLTLITQRFHAYRAVFIARHLGLDVVAYTAPTIPRRRSYRTEIREVFARVKAVLDLFFIDKQPRFLGEREEIRLDGDQAGSNASESSPSSRSAPPDS